MVRTDLTFMTMAIVLAAAVPLSGLTADHASAETPGVNGSPSGPPVEGDLKSAGPKPMPSGPDALKPGAEPDPNDPAARAALIEGLYGQLSKAPDQATAEKVVQTIERLWAISGSPTADLLMSRAIAAATAQRTDLALQFLDAVTELQPEWAEGFNRRAFLYVMKQDYGRALGDLRRVLALDAGNFRALEGLVQILRAMEQKKAALDAARELLKVHPHSQGIADTVKELERDVEGQGI